MTISGQVEIAVAGPRGPEWVPGIVEREYAIPGVTSGSRYDVQTARGKFVGISELSIRRVVQEGES